VSIYGLVRFELQGSLVSFYAGVEELQRGDWIVCRTESGLRIGRFVAWCSQADVEADLSGTQVICVRKATQEDRWLWKQLLDLNQKCLPVCQEYLDANGATDTLLEIESSLDGYDVVFHYLGEPSSKACELEVSLSGLYQSTVSESQIAKRLREGCGPTCGQVDQSEDGSGKRAGGGCGSAGGGGCRSCSASRSCAVSRASAK
jgi:hypothetical protein